MITSPTPKQGVGVGPGRRPRRLDVWPARGSRRRRPARSARPGSQRTATASVVPGDDRQHTRAGGGERRPSAASGPSGGIHALCRSRRPLARESIGPRSPWVSFPRRRRPGSTAPTRIRGGVGHRRRPAGGRHGSGRRRSGPRPGAPRSGYPGCRRARRPWPGTPRHPGDHVPVANPVQRRSPRPTAFGQMADHLGGIAGGASGARYEIASGTSPVRSAGSWTSGAAGRQVKPSARSPGTVPARTRPAGTAR